MSQYNASGHKGYIATAALRAGVLVKLSSGQVVVATAATDKIIGSVVNEVDAGDMADVRLLSAQGTSKMRAGGNVAVGDLLTSDADGEVILATQAAAGAQPTSVIVGRALEAGADNDLIEVENLCFLY